jgi:pimeloyl-ACP methyl ester carboxylesterase
MGFGRDRTTDIGPEDLRPRPDPVLELLQVRELEALRIITMARFALIAIMAPMAADDVIDAFPSIARWGIAGHSLGGVAAAQFAHARPDIIQALALYAAYPQEQHDLADRALPVLSLTGDLDLVLNRQNYEALRDFLPADTRFEVLEGGNHSQFGDYGLQEGDAPASIAPETQWDETVARTLSLLPGTTR